MTPEQRDEGRRLWNAFRGCTFVNYAIHAQAWTDWTRRHADALLADPAIDVAEIKREAVREFAESLEKRFIRFAEMKPEHDNSAPNRQGYLWAAIDVRELAAARGVTLSKNT